MLFGAGTPDRAKDQDYARIQGTWSVVSIQSGGNQDEDDMEKYTFTFEERRLILRELEDLAGVNFELDEKSSPKQITFARINGIYDFKDDYLHICYTTGRNRPAEFQTSEERPDIVLMVLKKNRQP
jgi:uncharacterized protein (TIGR03067 family)